MNKKVQRSKIPYIFLAFFAVIIVVNVCYVYISNKTWRGVVTNDSYQKGIRYNDAINQMKKQKDSGWSLKINYTRTSERGGIFAVVPLDKESALIKDAKIYVHFKRPTQSGFDFMVYLEFADGTYRTNVIFPMMGQWDAEIVVSKDENIFQEVKRYVIQ